MSRPTRYREIVVSGSAREMGLQLGELAREEVRGFCAVALESVNRTVRVTRERGLTLAADCVTHAERYSPHMMAELRAIAEAAGVSLEEMMLLQIRNQFQPARDGACTSLSVASESTADGHAIVAQNWDSDPALDEFTVVLTRRPTDQPAQMTVTQAGLISYLGFNDAGIGACVNTLPAPAREVGVPHYFTLRGIHESRSLDEAIQSVRRAERAIPANIMLATPQGPANLEITLDDVYVLRPEAQGWITHTNHCLHPRLAAINDDFPELIQSGPRKRRIDELCAEHAKAMTREAVQDMLRDHDQTPRSICRHPNEDVPHGFWTTVFSILMQPTAGCMYVSRGTPCSQPYERYDLRESH